MGNATLVVPSSHAEQLYRVIFELRGIGLDNVIVLTTPDIDENNAPTPGAPASDEKRYGENTLGARQLITVLDGGFTLVSLTAETVGMRTLIRIIGDWAYIVVPQKYYVYSSGLRRAPNYAKPDRNDPDDRIVMRYHFATCSVHELRAAMIQEGRRDSGGGRIAPYVLQVLVWMMFDRDPNLKNTMVETWEEAVQLIGWNGEAVASITD